MILLFFNEIIIICKKDQTTSIIFGILNIIENSKYGIHIYCFFLILFIEPKNSQFQMLIFTIYYISFYNRILSYTYLLKYRQILKKKKLSSKFQWINNVSMDKNYRGSFEIAQLFIYCLLIIYYFVFTHLFLNDDIMYMKGRSISWSNKLHVIHLFFIILIILFTRLVETLPKNISLIFSILTVIITVTYSIHVHKYLPFVNLDTNSYHFSLSISFLVGFVLQLISYYLTHIEPVFIIIVVIVLSIVLVLVHPKMNLKRQKKNTR